MHRSRLMTKMQADSLAELVRKTLGYTPTAEPALVQEERATN
jgi:hypothetical protein